MYIPQYLSEPTSPKMEHSLHFSNCLSPSNKWHSVSHPHFQHTHLGQSPHPHSLKCRTAAEVLCVCGSQSLQHILILETCQSSPRIFCNPGTKMTISFISKQVRWKNTALQSLAATNLFVITLRDILNHVEGFPDKSLPHNSYLK